MTDPRCGTLAGYQEHVTHGFEPCVPCRAGMAKAKAAYRRARYLRGPLHIDPTGTQRRLRALARMGWSTASLGERLGVSASAVTGYTRTRLVHRDTAAKVAELYDLLWDQRGPSKRVAMYAARHGWLPPLAYDDDSIDDPAASPDDAPPVDIDAVAVERAMRGYPTVLRRPERTEAVRRLIAQGLSAAQIAERLGVTKRLVTRHRSRDEVA